MIDRYTFEGEDFEDMSAPRPCETKEIKHCPFTGELIVRVEQKEFEPNFEAEFIAWYDRLSDEEHKAIQECI